ncbi:MAG: ferrous iron transport protein A [Chthonomonadales bacterium]|nr:ferrous iron transport protein A [Chthonomonadales bacterium]
MSLAEMVIGQTAYVRTVAHPSASTRHRLLSLGMVPGERIILEQRSPSFVIRVGWTRIALDRETAEQVFVTSEGHDGAIDTGRG